MTPDTFHGVFGALWRTGCASLIAMALVSCAPEPPPEFPIDASSVTVLLPVGASNDRERWLALVQDQIPHATYQSFETWAESSETFNGVLVVPAASHVPLTSVSVISDFLGRGGRVLFLGRDLYARQWDEDGRDRQARLARVAREASELSDFSSIQLWRFEQSDPSVRGAVRVARDATLPWPGVEVEPGRLDQYAVMRAVDLGDALLGTSFDTLLFYARGQGASTRLVLRARDQAGRVWVHVVALQPQWTLHAVSAADWRLSQERDEISDGFQLDQVTGFELGLDVSVAPQDLETHRFGVSDLRLLRAEKNVKPAWPERPFVADPTWRYATSGGRIRSERSDWSVRVRVRTMEALRPGGYRRYDAGPLSGRWIPLYRASERSGALRGDVAGLYAGVTPEGGSELWGWIGTDLERANRVWLPVAFREALHALQQGRYLVDAGVERYGYGPGQFFVAEGRAVFPDDAPEALRVAVEVVDDDGRIVRRATSSTLTQPGAAWTVNAGAVPVRSEETAAFTLRIKLEELGGLSRQFDMMEHPVWVRSGPATPVAQTESLRVSGSRITLGRVPIFFVGVDYDPGFPFFHEDGLANWLDAAYFDPVRVREDFERLRGMGMNAITISYRDVRDAPQVRYVLQLAQEFGIWVTVRLPDAMARATDTAWLARVVEDLDLRVSGPVGLLDLAPEGMDWMPGADVAWRQWVVEQLGGENAVQASWGDWLPRDDEGVWVLPSFDYVQEVDDAFVWGVYRRFIADQFSRRLGIVTRALRGHRIKPLLTVRSRPYQDGVAGWAGRWVPYDPAMGAVHVDVVGMELDWSGVVMRHPYDALVLAAYARGVSEGRPVLWYGIGAAMSGRQSAEVDEQYQVQVARMAFDLVMRTHAAGGYGRQFVPIPGEDEALFRADRHERPVAGVFRTTVHRLRDLRAVPQQWAGREVAHPDGPEGLSKLLTDWRSVYREQWDEGRMDELRLMGYGRLSTETPRDSVGDTQRSGPPYERMNGEWGRVERQREAVSRLEDGSVRVSPRERVRFEMLNTGTAAWAASAPRLERSVWVEVSHPGRRAQYLEVPYTGTGRSGWLDWTPPDEGVYTLRLYWWDVGPFGESLRVRVEQVPRD